MDSRSLYPPPPLIGGDQETPLSPSQRVRQEPKLVHHPAVPLPYFLSLGPASFPRRAQALLEAPFSPRSPRLPSLHHPTIGFWYPEKVRLLSRTILRTIPPVLSLSLPLLLSHFENAPHASPSLGPAFQAGLFVPINFMSLGLKKFLPCRIFSESGPAGEIFPPDPFFGKTRQGKQGSPKWEER